MILPKRVSARAGRDPELPPPPPLRDRVLEYIAKNGPAYCVDLGKAFGVRWSQAKAHLISLEAEGLLTSEWIPFPSGPGRRYYRLPKSAPAVTSAAAPAQPKAIGADASPSPEPP
jgi:predicted ArsR family transcriptional regulator